MSSSKLVAQAAALCVIDDKILLVTSKSGRRWVIPKGHLEDADQNTAARAEMEAWEEAGVIGTACDQSLGRYFYQKAGKIYFVEVHRLEGCSLANSWPEQGKRRRELVSLAEAIERVHEDDLKEILRQALEN